MTLYLTSDLHIDHYAEIRTEISNEFFYFNADEYLVKMKHKSIWLTGHTHDTGREVIHLGSKKVTLLLNSIGYPMETNDRYNLNSRKLFAMLNF